MPNAGPRPPRRKPRLKRGFEEISEDLLSPEFGAGLETARSVPKRLLTGWFPTLPSASCGECYGHLMSQEGRGWDQPGVSQSALRITRGLV